MSDNTNSAHEFTEGSEFKTETKEMEGKLKSLHHKLYDQIVMIPNGVKFLVAVNEGIEELKSLRSELQKAKELNGELSESLEKMVLEFSRPDYELFCDHSVGICSCVPLGIIEKAKESLIKKSNP